MTNQELADWLRDEPQEHREYMCDLGKVVRYEYSYTIGNGNKKAEHLLIRSNHGEWKEPIIEVEE